MADTPPSGIERRLVLRLLGRWRAVHSDGAMPTLQAMSAQDFTDIGHSLFLIKVEASGEHTFVRVGEQLTLEARADFAGHPIADVPEDTLLAQGIAHHATTVAKRVPVSLGGTFTNRAGNPWFYRSIILPLRSPRGGIGHLIGAVNGKPAG